MESWDFLRRESIFFKGKVSSRCITLQYMALHPKVHQQHKLKLMVTKLFLMTCHWGACRKFSSWNWTPDFILARQAFYQHHPTLEHPDRTKDISVNSGLKALSKAFYLILEIIYIQTTASLQMKQWSLVKLFSSHWWNKHLHAGLLIQTIYSFLLCCNQR